MPTQLKVAITKEIIRRCRNCGAENQKHIVGNNCAIAFALIDVFPNIYVGNHYILPLGADFEKEIRIPLPGIALQFIKLFDGFSLTPRLRLLLPEFEFTIDIPDEVIDQINIDDVRELIKAEKKYPVVTG